MRNPNGFGSVYKLSGRRRKPWIARITDGWETAIATKGKHKGEEVQRQKYKVLGYYRTSQEARDALTMHRVEPLSPKADITLKELYDEWSVKKYKKITRSTKDNYQAAWLHIKNLGEQKFNELRTAQWQGTIDKCNEQGMSHSTMRKVKTLVSMLYQYALENDISKKNYAKFIEIPKEEKKKRPTFSHIDIQKMLNNADTVPWVDTILIMIYSGMRISEMLQLTQFNVDLEKKIITGGIKTDAGKDRIIPIHPKIYPYIERWYNRKGQTLICRDDGSRIPVRYYRDNMYYQALDQLEIRRLTPHSCRHTFATMLDEAKVNTNRIKELIGHSDYAFTANTYTHVDIEELRKAIGMI